MFYKTEGIVLRETQYKDSDKLLNVLTKDSGKVTLKARGVRKNSSQLKSACQLLAYSEFTYQEIHGQLVIKEAVCKEMFPELRQDIEAISLAFYFAQAVDVLAEQDYYDPSLLSLLLNSLYALSKLKKPQAVVKAAFEWRLAAMAGYAPDLGGCAVCGKRETDRFNVNRGVLQCAGCQHEELDGLRMPVSPGTLAALRYIAACDEKKLFSFQLGDEAMRELSGIAETYLMTQLERGFSTLELYKSLFYTNFTNGE